MDAIRERFESVDVTKCGFLDLEGLQMLYEGAEEEDLVRLMTEFDQDADGKFSLADIEKVFLSLNSANVTSQIPSPLMKRQEARTVQTSVEPDSSGVVLRLPSVNRDSRAWSSISDWGDMPNNSMVEHSILGASSPLASFVEDDAEASASFKAVLQKACGDSPVVDGSSLRRFFESTNATPDEANDCHALLSKLEAEQIGGVSVDSFTNAFLDAKRGAAVTSTPTSSYVLRRKRSTPHGLGDSFCSKSPYSMNQFSFATQVVSEEQPSLSVLNADNTGYVKISTLIKKWQDMGLNITDKSAEIEEIIKTSLPYDSLGRVSVSDVTSFLESAVSGDEMAPEQSNSCTMAAIRSLALASFKTEISILKKKAEDKDLENEQLRQAAARVMEEKKRLVKEGDETRESLAKSSARSLERALNERDFQFSEKRKAIESQVQSAKEWFETENERLKEMLLKTEQKEKALALELKEVKDELSQVEKMLQKTNNEVTDKESIIKQLQKTHTSKAEKTYSTEDTDKLTLEVETLRKEIEEWKEKNAALLHENESIRDKYDIEMQKVKQKYNAFKNVVQSKQQQSQESQDKRSHRRSSKGKEKPFILEESKNRQGQSKQFKKGTALDKDADENEDGFKTSNFPSFEEELQLAQILEEKASSTESNKMLELQLKALEQQLLTKEAMYQQECEKNAQLLCQVNSTEKVQLKLQQELDICKAQLHDHCITITEKEHQITAMRFGFEEQLANSRKVVEEEMKKCKLQLQEAEDTKAIISQQLNDQNLNIKALVSELSKYQHQLEQSNQSQSELMSQMAELEAANRKLTEERINSQYLYEQQIDFLEGVVDKIQLSNPTEILTPHFENYPPYNKSSFKETLGLMKSIADELNKQMLYDSQHVNSSFSQLSLIKKLCEGIKTLSSHKEQDDLNHAQEIDAIVSSMEKLKTKHEQDIDEKGAEMAEICKKLQESNEDVKALKCQLTEESTNKNKRQQELNEMKESSLKELEELMKSHSTQKQHMQQQLDDYIKKIAEQEQMIAALGLSLSDQQSKIASLEDEKVHSMGIQKGLEVQLEEQRVKNGRISDEHRAAEEHYKQHITELKDALIKLSVGIQSDNPCDSHKILKAEPYFSKSSFMEVLGEMKKIIGELSKHTLSDLEHGTSASSHLKLPLIQSLHEGIQVLKSRKEQSDQCQAEEAAAMVESIKQLEQGLRTKNTDIETAQKKIVSLSEGVRLLECQVSLESAKNQDLKKQLDEAKENNLRQAEKVLELQHSQQQGLEKSNILQKQLDSQSTLLQQENERNRQLEIQVQDDTTEQMKLRQELNSFKNQLLQKTSEYEQKMKDAEAALEVKQQQLDELTKIEEQHKERNNALELSLIEEKKVQSHLQEQSNQLQGALKAELEGLKANYFQVTEEQRNAETRYQQQIDMLNAALKKEYSSLQSNDLFKTNISFGTSHSEVMAQITSLVDGLNKHALSDLEQGTSTSSHLQLSLIKNLFEGIELLKLQKEEYDQCQAQEKAAISSSMEILKQQLNKKDAEIKEAHETIETLQENGRLLERQITVECAKNQELQNQLKEAKGRLFKQAEKLLELQHDKQEHQIELNKQMELQVQKQMEHQQEMKVCKDQLLQQAEKYEQLLQMLKDSETALQAKQQQFDELRKKEGELQEKYSALEAHLNEKKVLQSHMQEQITDQQEKVVLLQNELEQFKQLQTEVEELRAERIQMTDKHRSAEDLYQTHIAKLNDTLRSKYGDLNDCAIDSSTKIYPSFSKTSHGEVLVHMKSLCDELNKHTLTDLEQATSASSHQKLPLIKKLYEGIEMLKSTKEQSDRCQAEERIAITSSIDSMKVKLEQELQTKDAKIQEAHTEIESLCEKVRLETDKNLALQKELNEVKENLLKQAKNLLELQHNRQKELEKQTILEKQLDTHVALQQQECKRIEQLEVQVQKGLTEQVELQQEFSACEDQLLHKTTECNQLIQKFRDSEAVLQAKQQQLEQILRIETEKNHSLQKELNEVKESLLKQAENLLELQHNRQEELEKQTILEKQLDTHVALQQQECKRIEQLEVQVQKGLTEQVELQQELSACENQLLQKTAEYDQLVQNLKDSEVDQQTKQQQLEELTKTVKQQEENISVLKLSLDEEKNIQSHLHEQILDQKNKILLLQDELEHSTQMHCVLKAKVEDLSAKNAEVIEEHQNAQVQFQQHTAKLHDALKHLCGADSQSDGATGSNTHFKNYPSFSKTSHGEVLVHMKSLCDELNKHTLTDLQKGTLSSSHLQLPLIKKLYEGIEVLKSQKEQCDLHHVEEVDVMMSSVETMKANYEHEISAKKTEIEQCNRKLEAFNETIHSLRERNAVLLAEHMEKESQHAQQIAKLNEIAFTVQTALEQAHSKERSEHLQCIASLGDEKAHLQSCLQSMAEKHNLEIAKNYALLEESNNRSKHLDKMLQQLTAERAAELAQHREKEEQYFMKISELTQLFVASQEPLAEFDVTLRQHSNNSMSPGSLKFDTISSMKMHIDELRATISPGTASPANPKKQELLASKLYTDLELLRQEKQWANEQHKEETHSLQSQLNQCLETVRRLNDKIELLNNAATTDEGDINKIESTVDADVLNNLQPLWTTVTLEKVNITRALARHLRNDVATLKDSIQCCIVQHQEDTVSFIQSISAVKDQLISRAVTMLVTQHDHEILQLQEKLALKMGSDVKEDLITSLNAKEQQLLEVTGRLELAKHDCEQYREKIIDLQMECTQLQKQNQNDSRLGQSSIEKSNKFHKLAGYDNTDSGAGVEEITNKLTKALDEAVAVSKRQIESLKQLCMEVADKQDDALHLLDHDALVGIIRKNLHSIKDNHKGELIEAQLVAQTQADSLRVLCVSQLSCSPDVAQSLSHAELVAYVDSALQRMINDHNEALCKARDMCTSQSSQLKDLLAWLMDSSDEEIGNLNYTELVEHIKKEIQKARDNHATVIEGAHRQSQAQTESLRELCLQTLHGPSTVNSVDHSTLVDLLKEHLTTIECSTSTELNRAEAQTQQLRDFCTTNYSVEAVQNLSHSELIELIRAQTEKTQTVLCLAKETAETQTSDLRELVVEALNGYLEVGSDLSHQQLLQLARGELQRIHNALEQESQYNQQLVRQHEEIETQLCDEHEEEVKGLRQQREQLGREVDNLRHALYESTARLDSTNMREIVVNPAAVEELRSIQMKLESELEQRREKMEEQSKTISELNEEKNILLKTVRQLCAQFHPFILETNVEDSLEI